MQKLGIWDKMETFLGLILDLSGTFSSQLNVWSRSLVASSRGQAGGGSKGGCTNFINSNTV